MSPRLALFGALTVAAVMAAPAGRTAAQSQQPPVFRAGVELIAVDLEVVDSTGHPLSSLGPDKFTVTIDGKKRKVVTADFIRYGSSRDDDTSMSPGVAGNAAGAAPPPTGPAGRVIVVAVDCMSFSVTDSRQVIGAAQDFVRRLLPDDRVGVFAFPIGPQLDPTPDHAKAALALQKIVGQRDPLTTSRFNLRPSELIDLSLWANHTGNGEVPALVTQLCPDANDSECPFLLQKEVQFQTLMYEGQAYASLGTFRGLLRSLGSIESRTTVVLLSAGIVASDIVGGRPNLGDFGTIIGRDATRSNLSVYTLFMDSFIAESNRAETRRARNTNNDLARDSQVLSRWLDQFTGMAGGALLPILSGRGDAAFDRVLTESSAYYLLGVEPQAADRDGRMHDINVKVPGATVRGRKWVVVPKPGATPASRSPSAPSPSPSLPPHSTVPFVPSTSLAPVIAAFERGDDDAVHRLVAAANDPAVLIREVRMAGGALGPGNPRREALLGLEMALMGLRAPAPTSREEAARALVQYAALARQSESADAFECGWYLAEAAGLPTAYQPAVMLTLMQRAQQRCPDEPRLALAAAVAKDQQWPTQLPPLLPGDPVPEADAARLHDVSVLYDAAAKSPNTEAEARVRQAWFFLRIHQLQRAREALDSISMPPADPRVRYLLGLVRGQVLRAQGQSAAAIAAFRDALVAVPGATAASAALMTELMTAGDRAEAEAIAQRLQSTGGTAPNDPWWTFWLGDVADYPARIARLRELLK